MFFRGLHPARLIPYLLFLLFTNASGVAGSNTGNAHLFPTPSVLEPNVEFWKNVYAKYSERDVIIHDSWDLSIVYEVLNLDDLVDGAKVSSRIEWKKVEQVKKRYKRLLLKLAARKRIDVERLSGEEKRVASLFGSRVTAKQLRTASRRIRGQTGLRERFKKGLERSGMYIDQIRDIFLEAGLPLELSFLPHVESSFNYNAYSKLGAAGLWQFTRSTGRLYMKINYVVDERLDPIRATRAAARLLKDNYDRLGAWPLAITAYNHGPNGMKRAKRKFGTDMGKIVKHYKSRSFGFASRNFYAEFLAALEIATHHEEYFLEVRYSPPQDFIEFKLPHYVRLKSLLDKLQIDLHEFATYNPALRRPVLESRRRIPKDYVVRIPHEKGLDVETAYAEISAKFKYDAQVRPDWHKVRSGETLSRISRRYGVSVQELVALNDIGDAHQIYIGQSLQIPDGKRQIGATVARANTRKQPKETRLADASATSFRSAGLVDTPVRGGGRAADIKHSDEVLPARRGADNPQKSIPVRHLPDIPKERNEALSSVDVQKIESLYESVDNVMAMALPGYYVEMDRDMDLRVVRQPKLEVPDYVFRDIEMPKNGRIMVEPEETLGHLADWLDVQTYKLRRINHLGASSSIKIGQNLILSFENVTPEEFHRRRVEYHQGIEEDFYRNFTVHGEKIYHVQPGENIWTICNRTVEIPHWLIKKYNADKKLTALIAGEEIVIPIVEARVPEAMMD